MEKVSIEREEQEDSQDFYIKNIIESVNSLDFFSMKSSINKAIKAGVSSIDVIKKGILTGLEESGEMGLILAAEALQGEALEIEKETRRKDMRYSGKIVVGTIEGDIHDLGKNILIALLKSYGMEIIDLGIDVSPKRFEEAARLSDVKVVGISFLLSSAEPAIRRVMAILKNDELANKVKVILGGAAASIEIAEETNADAYARNAIEGLDIIAGWLK